MHVVPYLAEIIEDDPLPNTACAANKHTIKYISKLPTSTLNNYASIEKQAHRADMEETIKEQLDRGASRPRTS